MKTIADRISLLLEKRPRTIKQLQRELPEVGYASIISTISKHHGNWFIRIRKGYYGIRGIHDHLIEKHLVQQQGSLALYQRMVNLLVGGPLELIELYSLLPRDSEVLVRNEISLRKDLFLLVKTKDSIFVGRVGRDEYLVERHTKNFTE